MRRTSTDFATDGNVMINDFVAHLMRPPDQACELRLGARV